MIKVSEIENYYRGMAIPHYWETETIEPALFLRKYLELVRTTVINHNQENS